MKVSSTLLWISFSVTVALLLTGCASKRMAEFSFSDMAGVPVTNVVAVTYKPASFLEKVFNPIGAFYHPFWPVKVDTPDLHGMISYPDMPAGYHYYFYVPESTDVQCLYNGQTNLVRITKLGDKETRKLFEMNGSIIYAQSIVLAPDKEWIWSHCY